MAILKIARMGHPILQQRAAEVAEPGSAEIARLVADMRATLADSGGVGLAAPQVHVGLRVVIFEVPGTRTTDENSTPDVPPTVLINPVIEPASEEIAIDWEGCLSVPYLRGAVPRLARIRYRGLGLDGAPVEREIDGLRARIVQHECDHLDGILYPMRMPNLTSLHYVSEIRNNPLLQSPVAKPPEDRDVA